MQLSQNELLLLSHQAISAAQQAGQLISQYAKKDIIVRNKNTGENLASQVVTEVDLLSQSLILDTLSPSCEHYDLALLSEENTDDRRRLEKDYFWCIDPLDGTLPFIESTPGYAVSIALVSRLGIPMIGVIYDPTTQTLYHAIKNNGAFRNGKPISSMSETKKNRFTLISDRSLKQQPYYKELLKEFKNIAKKLGLPKLHVIAHGGAAMNACWVLENNPACYFKFPKPQDGGGSLWDFSASACLFHEIGAIACDIHGTALDLNRPDSTFMNHRGIIYTYNQEIMEKIRAYFYKIQSDIGW